MNPINEAYWRGWHNGYRCAIEDVHVVRCIDCKWYESAYLKRDGTDDKRFKPSVCVRGTYAKPRKAEWYCADGERRSEDG